ncbi:MAG: sulfite exporter TauE/SafE family protein [Phycisphaerales bacterium]|nr:sulfite exporter TauE/SafE family protein [Phycisphaerales bacterium]
MSLTRIDAAGCLQRYSPFLWWVAWFLLAWLTVVFALDLVSLVKGHWPIATAMVFGSYIAGSTPMGGGTVGFPLLVLVFDGPASLGRGFSFCIQSVGMSSATLFILCSRQPIVVRTLLWSAATATVVVPGVLAFVVPHVSDSVVKLSFACIWGGFGILTLVKLRELLGFSGAPRLSGRSEAGAGVAIGLIGGAAAALTGVGIDMVLYTVLVLLFRVELRSAIATSVVIMAYTSLLGAVWSAILGRLDAEIFANWMAAAPVVLLGAPLGSLLLRVIPRGPTLVLVSVLCVLQLVYASTRTVHTAMGWAGVVGAVLAMNAVFHWLYSRGERLHARRGAGPAPPGAV